MPATAIGVSLDSALGDLVEQSLRKVLAEAPHVLPPQPLVLSVTEVATVMRVSKRSVETWVAEGVLPKMPHTGRVLIPRQFVENWVAEIAEAAEQPERPRVPRRQPLT